MKIIFFACATIFLTTNLHAQVVTTATLSGKDNDIKLGQCHYKLHDAFNGEVRLSTRSKPQIANYSGPLMRNLERSEVTVQMWCDSSSAKHIADFSAVKLDGDIWSMAYENEAETTDDKIKQSNTTLVVINGKGWSGAGVTEDQTDGDPHKRVRSFVFCLPHGGYAVCGRVGAVASLENIRYSAMPSIKKLLESIEFVDDAVGNSTPYK